MKFCYTNQTVVRSSAFYHVMSGLDRKMLINPCRNHSKAFYTLTDRGRMIANELAKDFDTPKEFWFLGTRKYIEWG